MTAKHETIDEVDGEEQLREIVERDYRRMSGADDAWTVLDIPPGTRPKMVKEQYEAYESFYRPENLRQVDDADLLEKTIEIRTMISRAAVEIQREQPTPDATELGLAETSPVVESVDADSAAMAEIYYRDGLSWLSLDAIEASLHCFQRSLDYHPGRGDALAYHAYLQFKNSPNSPRVAETCRDELRTAANIAPQNPEIHVLRARFALESGLADLAEDCLMRIRDIDPDHPDLPKLESVHEELVQD